MTAGRAVAAAMAVLASALAVVGCSDDRPPTPVVGDIGAGIEAVDAETGGLDYFEISANLERVQLVTASPLDDGEAFTAQRWIFDDGELDGPTSIGEAEGRTFSGDALDIEAESVFDGIFDELDDPVITDFAIVGAPDGVLYDATVLSDSGGAIAVRLSGDGDVLAVNTG